jgi:predicted aminopeptidase
MSLQRQSRLALVLLVVLLESGCSISYYWQASRGQMSIVRGREPVTELLQEPELDPVLRSRLELSQQVLRFAHDQLLLPDNGSYTTYFDTGHPYVVWNVFAAPEFSLQARTWCFPVAGCIAYRGYFNETRARSYADNLSARGDDVLVGGVSAYSTLGRFKDPILNTMLNSDDADFIGLLFHELAHQLLYVQDDSAFNEGFASAVEYEGLRRWQRARGLGSDIAAQANDSRQRQDVMALLENARAQLKSLYMSAADDADKRVRKQEIYAELSVAYERMATAWKSDGLVRRPYGSLFKRGLNNASLGAIGTYADYVPAFDRLLDMCGGELVCFYDNARSLGRLSPDSRRLYIERLIDVQSILSAAGK